MNTGIETAKIQREWELKNGNRDVATKTTLQTHSHVSVHCGFYVSRGCHYT